MTRPLPLVEVLRRRRILTAGDRIRTVRAAMVADRVARLDKQRHVRTPEGAKKYGKPIGSPIGGGRLDTPSDESNSPARASGIENMPPIRELFDLDEDELFATFQAGFDGPYGRAHEGQPPLQLAMTEVETESNAQGRRAIHAYGRVLDGDGNPVGKLQRTFYLEPDGEVHVEHALLKLDEDVRGRGFSTNLFGDLRGYYQRSGATRISIYASDDDGGWAWARTGFEFNNANGHMTGSNRSMMLQQIMNVHRDPATSTRDQDLTHELLMRFSGPPDGWPSPLEISRLAGDNPRLGEAIMRGSDWYGVMWL